MNQFKKTTTDLPDWSFSVEEISAGVYKIRGTDKAERSVEATGTNPEILFEECVLAAKKIKDLELSNEDHT